MIHVSLFCSGSPHWRASTVRACDTTCTHYFSSWVFSWFEENDTTINFIFSFFYNILHKSRLVPVCRTRGGDLWMLWLGCITSVDSNSLTVQQHFTEGGSLPWRRDEEMADVEPELAETEPSC